MKKKIWLVFLLSLFFYAVLHLSGHLPGLLQGKFTYVDERPLTGQFLSLLAGLLLSFLFTLATYLLFYYFYPAKKYSWMAFGLLTSFLLLFLLGYAWNQAIEPYPASISRFFRNNVLFTILYILMGLAIYLIRYNQYRELQEKELQVQARNSELSFLKSQINPHFLFNNLNNIYSLVYTRSDQALNAIAGLSELLRYMLYNPSDTIALPEEIGYIEKFIELQQLRYESPTRIKINCQEEQAQVMLPPLLLIPFIENAFKHGAASTAEDWLWVNVAFDQHTLTFECINKIGLDSRKDQTGGIGIENVRKRLELLYPDRHSLAISLQKDLFTVKVHLNYD